MLIRFLAWLENKWCIPKINIRGLGIHVVVDVCGRWRILMGLEILYLLDFRHEKRRPWTSLDVELVGRGNLNWIFRYLI